MRIHKSLLAMGLALVSFFCSGCVFHVSTTTPRGFVRSATVQVDGYVHGRRPFRSHFPAQVCYKVSFAVGDDAVGCENVTVEADGTFHVGVDITPHIGRTVLLFRSDATLILGGHQFKGTRMSNSETHHTINGVEQSVYQLGLDFNLSQDFDDHQLGMAPADAPEIERVMASYSVDGRASVRTEPKPGEAPRASAPNAPVAAAPR